MFITLQPSHRNIKDSIPIEFSFDLLLPSQLQEFPSILHSFPLLGELSKDQSDNEKIKDHISHPDNTPNTRLSMKNEPRTMRGMKYAQLYVEPIESFVCMGTI